MIEMMLGEAQAVETKRKQATHEATVSAIAAAFSKGEVGYDNALTKALEKINDGRLKARGIAPDPVVVQPDPQVQKVLRILRSGKQRRKK